MSQNIIYCFSGSGNCLDIAKNIAKELGDTDIVSIKKMPVIRNATNYKTVGFVFPCHGGGLPCDMEKYLGMLNVSFASYTYGVVSYAGYPGVGMAKLNKRIPLDYWNKISHHCSCIWLFPHQLMLPMLSAKKAQKRSEKLAKEIAQDIKKRVIIEESVPENAFNNLESKVFPSLNMKKIAQFNVDSEKCTTCGMCEKLCPKGNIKISGGKAEIGTNCIGCLSCLQFCPTEAINIGKITIGRQRYHNANIKANELMKDIIHID